jgi:hypothetical protein
MSQQPRRYAQRRQDDVAYAVADKRQAVAVALPNSDSQDSPSDGPSLHDDASHVSHRFNRNGTAASGSVAQPQQSREAAPGGNGERAAQPLASSMQGL